MYPEINVVDGSLTVSGYTGSVDLTTYPPGKIRVYDDGAGNLSVDPGIAFWLLAEVVIPGNKYESIGEGEEQTQIKLAMNDDDVAVTPWPLKEA
jgi:hypothetical protein